MDGKLSKKQQRMQNKLLKVKAFLRVAEENESEPVSKKTKLNINYDDSSEVSEADDKYKIDKSTSHKLEEDVTNKNQLETAAKCPFDIKSLEVQLKEKRAQVIARKKLSLERPKIYMNKLFLSENLEETFDLRDNPSIDEKPSPLFIIDMQYVLLLSIQGNVASFKPRFCCLLRTPKIMQAMVIVVDGLSRDSYEDNKESFTYLKENFPIKVPLVSPMQYGSSVADDLFNVPISKTQLNNSRVCKDIWKQDTHEENSLISFKGGEVEDTEPTGNTARKPPSVNTLMGTEENNVGATMDTEKLPKTLNRIDLLINPQQMIHEKYPMPAHTGQFEGFKTSKKKYKSVTASSPMFAIDCEMCRTEISPSELTWVAVVNENLEVVYESLVKPRNKIIDYITRFSGVTPKMLKDVKTRLEDVQAALQSLLPDDAILCGQSFNNDLKALQIFHPYVIDTSVIFNRSGARSYKTGLKRLAQEFLGETIQAGGKKGHSPVEDSITTMKLVLHKLNSADLSYGDVILENSNLLMNPTNKQELTAGSNKLNSQIAVKKYFFGRPGSKFTRSFFDITKKCQKSVLFVDREADAAPYSDKVDACHVTGSDHETVKVVKDHMTNHNVAWVHLHNAAKFGESDEDAKQKLLLKTDKHIRKLVKQLEDNSLVFVIFTGRCENDEIHNSLGCIGITNSAT